MLILAITISGEAIVGNARISVSKLEENMLGFVRIDEPMRFFEAFREQSVAEGQRPTPIRAIAPLHMTFNVPWVDVRLGRWCSLEGKDQVQVKQQYEEMRKQENAARAGLVIAQPGAVK